MTQSEFTRISQYSCGQTCASRETAPETIPLISISTTTTVTLLIASSVASLRAVVEEIWPAKGAVNHYCLSVKPRHQRNISLRQNQQTLSHRSAKYNTLAWRNQKRGFNYQCHTFSLRRGTALSTIQSSKQKFGKPGKFLGHGQRGTRIPLGKVFSAQPNTKKG